MSIALSDLVTRLSGSVPANDGVPSSAQYEQCVVDAVLDFSQRASIERVTSLSIVRGTADYALPSDFVRFISLARFDASEGILNTADGLIPVSASLEESISVRNGVLTIYPVPSYAMSRELHYGAGWVKNDTDEYETMGEREAAIVLLKAQALALDILANALSLQAWRYSIEGDSVDKTQTAKALREQAERLGGQYESAAKTYVGQLSAAEASRA